MENQINKERTHLFSPASNVAVKFDISGIVNEEDIKAAIKKAVQNNEILNCKIDLNNKGEAFYTKISEPVYSVEQFNEYWADTVVRHEKIRFKIENGELIRFFLHLNEDTTELLIIAHHLAGDGISISYLVQDILSALSNEELIYKPLELCKLKDFPEDSRLNLPMRLMLQGMNSKWDKTGKAFSFEDFERMFNKYWLNHKTKIYSYTLNNEEFQGLVCESKKQKITINSIITTALLRSAAEKVNVGLAVNIRKQSFTGMGNYSTGISIKYIYDEKKDFWTNAEAVQKLIYAKLADNKKKYFLLQFMGNLDPTLIDAAYFSAYDGYENKTAKTFQKMFGYDSNPKGISISNLTRLPIPSFYRNCSITDYIFVPPLVPNARRVLGISTLNNRMTVTLHIEDNSETALKNEFFKKALEYLKKWSF